MAFRTTGPLYVEPRFRDADNLFGLLLSNLSGSTQTVQVEIFAAKFSALNTPETWVKTVNQTVTVPNSTVANLVFPIPSRYPYYQFFITSSGVVRPSLYLLNNLGDAVQDFPLVPSGGWETI